MRSAGGVANLSFVRVEMGTDYCFMYNTCRGDFEHHRTLRAAPGEGCPRQQDAKNTTSWLHNDKSCHNARQTCPGSRHAMFSRVRHLDCSSGDTLQIDPAARVCSSTRRKGCAELPRPHPIIAHQGQHACWAHRDHLHARILHHQTHTPHPGKHTTHSSRSGLSRGALRQ